MGGCYSRKDDPELPRDTIGTRYGSVQEDDEEDYNSEEEVLILPDGYENYTDFEKYKVASKSESLELL